MPEYSVDRMDASSIQIRELGSITPHTLKIVGKHRLICQTCSRSKCSHTRAAKKMINWDGAKDWGT